MILVFAPTSDYPEYIKNSWKKYLFIALGEWNTKAGEDAYSIWSNAIGSFGIVKKKCREIQLEITEKYILVIANTLYNHMHSRKTIWYYPDGMTHNQINYILTPQRFKSSIQIIQTITRTYPRATINSDHYLIICNNKNEAVYQQKE